jgi:hypothetical protein
MNLKYIIKVFIIVFLILSLIIFINTIGLNLNEDIHSKKLLQVVTIEGLEGLDDPLIMDKSVSFCESHKGSSGSLDESCGNLTTDNCKSTSCCVFTNDNKCVAGSQDGPTFNIGKTKGDKFYFFQGKCYGIGCPIIKI